MKYAIVSSLKTATYETVELLGIWDIERLICNASVMLYIGLYFLLIHFLLGMGGLD